MATIHAYGHGDNAAATDPRVSGWRHRSCPSSCERSVPDSALAPQTYADPTRRAIQAVASGRRRAEGLSLALPIVLREPRRRARRGPKRGRYGIPSPRLGRRRALPCGERIGGGRGPGRWVGPAGSGRDSSNPVDLAAGSGRRGRRPGQPRAEARGQLRGARVVDDAPPEQARAVRGRAARHDRRCVRDERKLRRPFLDLDRPVSYEEEACSRSRSIPATRATGASTSTPSTATVTSRSTASSTSAARPPAPRRARGGR